MIVKKFKILSFCIKIQIEYFFFWKIILNSDDKYK